MYSTFVHFSSFNCSVTSLTLLIELPTLINTHIPFLFVSSDVRRLAYFSAWVAPNHLATC